MENDKSQKKARLDPPTRDNFPEILPLALEERFETIRQWIAKPIDSFRDEDGIFRDPFPATVMVKKEANDRRGRRVRGPQGSREPGEEATRLQAAKRRSDVHWL